MINQNSIIFGSNAEFQNWRNDHFDDREIVDSIFCGEGHRQWISYVYNNNLVIKARYCCGEHGPVRVWVNN